MTASQPHHLVHDGERRSPCRLNPWRPARATAPIRGVLRPTRRWALDRPLASRRRKPVPPHQLQMAKADQATCAPGSPIGSHEPWKHSTTGTSMSTGTQDHEPGTSETGNRAPSDEATPSASRPDERSWHHRTAACACVSVCLREVCGRGQILSTSGGTGFVPERNLYCPAGRCSAPAAGLQPR